MSVAIFLKNAGDTWQKNTIRMPAWAAVSEVKTSLKGYTREQTKHHPVIRRRNLGLLAVGGLFGACTGSENQRDQSPMIAFDGDVQAALRSLDVYMQVGDLTDKRSVETLLSSELIEELSPAEGGPTRPYYTRYVPTRTAEHLRRLSIHYTRYNEGRFDVNARQSLIATLLIEHLHEKYCVTREDVTTREWLNARVTHFLPAPLYYGVISKPLRQIRGTGGDQILSYILKFFNEAQCASYMGLALWKIGSS